MGLPAAVSQEEFARLTEQRRARRRTGGSTRGGPGVQELGRLHHKGSRASGRLRCDIFRSEICLVDHTVSREDLV